MITLSCLMPYVGSGGYSKVVDIFHLAAGTWTTAALSEARTFLAATSLPNAGLAIFAGGESTLSGGCVWGGLEAGAGVVRWM